MGEGGRDLSSPTDRVRDMCVPMARCTPKHLLQRKTPKVMEAKRGFLSEQSAQDLFAGSCTPGRERQGGHARVGGWNGAGEEVQRW